MLNHDIADTVSEILGIGGQFHHVHNCNHATLFVPSADLLYLPVKININGHVLQRPTSMDDPIYDAMKADCANKAGPEHEAIFKSKTTSYTHLLSSLIFNDYIDRLEPNIAKPLLNYAVNNERLKLKLNDLNTITALKNIGVKPTEIAKLNRSERQKILDKAITPNYLDMSEFIQDNDDLKTLKLPQTRLAALAMPLREFIHTEVRSLSPQANTVFERSNSLVIDRLHQLTKKTDESKISNVINMNEYR